MIPYFPQPVWRVGGVEVHAFGVTTAIALNAGYLAVVRLAARGRLNGALAARLYLAMAIAGALAGHLAYVIANPRIANWWRIWSGQSAAGFAAALMIFAAAIYIWCSPPWGYLNLYGFTSVFVWTIFRAGCAMAHDHPGRLTSSPLGVRFPSGTRFDLGLVEFLAGAIVCAAFLVLRHFQFRAFFPAAMITIGAVRLALATLTEQSGVRTVHIVLFAAMCLAGIALLRPANRDYGTCGKKTNPR